MKRLSVKQAEALSKLSDAYLAVSECWDNGEGSERFAGFLDPALLPVFDLTEAAGELDAILEDDEHEEN